MDTKIATAARRLIKKYDSQTERLEKDVAKIHDTILEFGRLLAEGREKYQANAEFGGWIVDNNLNTGRLAADQQERTACMTLASLVDESGLDLAECKVTTPTNILKWARKEHIELFPELQAKREQKKARGAVTRKSLADDVKRLTKRTEILQEEMEDVRHNNGYLLTLLQRVLKEAKLTVELRTAIEALLNPAAPEEEEPEQPVVRI